MKITIIGGGIGGLTTAIALQQHGFDAHVYEAAPEIRPIGKGIWLPTNAMLVMERLGLAEELIALGMELDRIEIHDKTAGVLQSIDLVAVKKRFGRTTTSILRSDLQSTLAAHVAPGTLHLGKRCQRVSQTPGVARIDFADGTTEWAELVIGADGIRSVVRESVKPNIPLRFSGQTCYLGVANGGLSNKGAPIVKEIWGGTHRFGYSAVGAGKVYWFAPIAVQERNTPAPTDPLTMLRTAYADFPAPVQEILDCTDSAEIIKVDLNDFAPIHKWHEGGIVLLGDAAHAMTPNAGQGGAQAIEDAYALAKMLTEHDSLETALPAYTALRRPKAHRITTLAYRMGQLAHTRSLLLRTARNTIFKATPKRLNQQQIESLYSLNF